MAVALARVPATCTHIPIGILAMAMRIETEAFVADTMELITLIQLALEQVQGLRNRLDEIGTNVDKLLEFTERLLKDTEPVWDDTYNLCGDPSCDGTCMVCQDGEYIEDDGYTEKYCHRGKR